MAKKRMRLSEVCRQLDLQPYVLRYWLTEFPQLAGGKGSDAAGQRGFDAAEVALLERIKGLLYEEGYTIAGAKKKLESDPGGKASTLFDEPATEGAEEDEEPVEAAGDETPVSLDTPDDERIETLRRGVAAALEEAREILSLLEAQH